MLADRPCRRRSGPADRRESTTSNVRIRRSVSGLPLDVSCESATVAVTSIDGLPVASGGSANRTGSKAVPLTVVGASPSAVEATVNSTGSPAWRLSPKARSWMAGRSEAR